MFSMETARRGSISKQKYDDLFLRREEGKKVFCFGKYCILESVQVKDVFY